MKIKNKSAFLIFCLLTASTISFAQDTRLHSRNDNAWLMYFGNHKFSNRFGLHAEVQWRRTNFFSDNQQLLLRTGLDYYLKDNSRITVGYAFVESYPYGEFPVAKAYPEHRIWEQYTTSQTLGKVKLAHRYRLEQRLIGNSTTGEFENGRYENRFRYQVRATMNITKGERPVYGTIYDEIFLNFGKEVAYNLFDQNRAYAAVGFTLSPTVKLETGYLLQTVQQRSLDMTTGTPKNKLENNYTIQIGLTCTVPFVSAGK